MLTLNEEVSTIIGHLDGICLETNGSITFTHRYGDDIEDESIKGVDVKLLLQQLITKMSPLERVDMLEFFKHVKGEQ